MHGICMAKPDIPVIGLTGGIGSGKSAVADRFAAHGIPVVDTDQIAHDLTGPDGAAMPAILQAFGPGVQSANGALDRTVMRQRVFADPAVRKVLEAILHPMIRQASFEALSQSGGPYRVLVVPLLFETGHYQPWLARTLVVDCDEALQKERVMRRNGLSQEAVAAIMAAQLPRAERLARADDVIVNNGALEELMLQVDDKHHYYLANFAKTPQ